MIPTIKAIWSFQIPKADAAHFVSKAKFWLRLVILRFGGYFMSSSLLPLKSKIFANEK
jgi:hypothetical protein